MNYIELIRNFWKVFRQNEFGSLEIGLYFHLIEFANSLNWPKSFKLPNSNIIETLDCSASKLHRARKNLVTAGLIKYEPGSKSNPGIYSIQSATYPLANSYQPAINDRSIRIQSNSSSVKEQNAVEDSAGESICYPSVNDEQATCDQSANRSLNKTKLNKTKHKTHRLSKDNLSVKLTDASSESVDSDQSLKNEREVSSEGKAEESQKSDSTVETSPSKAKPSNSIDEFFDGLLSGKSMNEMLFDSPPKDEATYIPPNDSQLFSPSHTPFENIRLVFVECCPSLPAPKEAKSWTEKRKRTVKSRWKKNPSMDFWYGFFQKVEDSDFLSGRKTDWRASFDWIMKPANFEKISEGCYDNAPDQMAQVLDRFMRREW